MRYYQFEALLPHPSIAVMKQHTNKQKQIALKFRNSFQDAVDTLRHTDRDAIGCQREADVETKPKVEIDH